MASFFFFFPTHRLPDSQMAQMLLDSIAINGRSKRASAKQDYHFLLFGYFVGFLGYFCILIEKFFFYGLAITHIG